jgi:hypothetical protein
VLPERFSYRLFKDGALFSDFSEKSVRMVVPSTLETEVASQSILETATSFSIPASTFSSYTHYSVVAGGNALPDFVDIPFAPLEDTVITVPLPAQPTLGTFEFVLLLEGGTGECQQSRYSFSLSIDGEASRKRRGNALKFNGTNQLAATSNVLSTANSNVTLEAWIKIDAYPSSSALIVYNGNAAAGNGYGLLLGAGGKLFALHSGVNMVENSGVTLLLNTWMHLAYRINNANAVLVFLNGQEIISTNMGAYTPTGTFQIGDAQFAGEIDEVRFWNVVRNSNQIRETMHLTLPEGAAGLSNYYPFNDVNVAFANDWVGNMPATFQNAPARVASGANVGKGTSFIVASPSAGIDYEFSGTGVTLNFGVATTGTITVSRLEGLPVGTQVSGSTPFTNHYWIINNDWYGALNEGLNITATFELGTGLLTSDEENYPQRVKGNARGTNSAGAWAGSNATSATASSGTAVFSGINSLRTEWAFSLAPIPVWDGTAWENGMPTATLGGLINGSYNVGTNGNIVAKNLSIGTGGTLDMPSGSITLHGDFSNNGTFAQTGGVFTMGGAAAQQISGSTAFSHLEIDNAAGVSLADTVYITDKLTIGSGTLQTNGRLVLRSTASGTAYVVGSLAGISGAVRVERYVKDNSGEAWSDYGGAGYRYFSSPIVGATVGDFKGFAPDLAKAAAYNANHNTVTNPNFPNFFFYNEARIGAGQAFARGWNVPLSTAAPIAQGAGFIANLNAGATTSMSGTLSSGDISRTVSRGGQGDSGWNLLGNPYASPLDLHEFLSDNSATLDGSAYIRIATSQYAGTWASYTTGGGGIGSPSGAIDAGIMAPMQGFFVRKSAQGTGTAMFSERQRADAGFNTFRKAAEMQGLVRIGVEADGRRDESVAYFQQGATGGFDPAYDAYKVQYNPAGFPTLWQGKSPNGMLQISGMGEVADSAAVPLSLWAEHAGEHAFSALEMKGLEGFDVSLEDRRSGAMHSLRGAQPYRVSLEKGMHEGRFFLHIVAKVTGTDDPSRAGIALYSYEGHIRIRLPEGMQEATASIFDLTGRLAQEHRVGAEANIEAGLPEGVYLVRITTPKGTFAKRIYLK